MISYIIIAGIIMYSGWIIYKTIRDKLKGECSSCSECSISNSCSSKGSKLEMQQIKLNKRYNKK